MSKAIPISKKTDIDKLRDAVERQQLELRALRREIEIQESLDRVRARTMAMQHSDELMDTSSQLFKEFVQLGAHAEQLSIGIIDEESKVLEVYGTLKGHQLDQVYKADIGAHTVIRKVFDAWVTKKDKLSAVIVIEGEELESYDRWRNKLSGGRFYQNPAEQSSPVWMIHLAFFRYGVLSLSAGELAGFETLQLLERFAALFDQTYTRFLDLQKAEAQAREAQIVASLERVRASTMAMQHSEGLSDVLSVLFEQFDILQINPSHAVLTLIDQEKDTLTFQMTGKHGHRVVAEQEVALEVADAWVDTTEKWKKSKPNSVNVNEYPAELLPEIWAVYHDLLAVIPEHARPRIEEFPNGLFITEGYCRFGYIGFAHYRRPTDEEKDIVKRFAAEFGTLYQRFLDLKKAEDQAKEAMIEAALEKVRSRSMGMQKSNELKEVIQLVYDQFVLLEVPVEHTGFIIDYDTREDMYIWLADKNGAPSEISIPYFDSPHWNSFVKAKDEGKDFFTNTLSFDEKNLFYKKLFNHIPDLPEKAKEFYFSCPGLAISTVLLDNVGLYIENFTGTPYRQNENAILMRFGKVFQQAYTRFRDLQKAEHQVREAQIEAALERIRSRTMAMQHSEELMETSGLLFGEFKQLGAEAEQLSIGIIDSRMQEIEVFGTFQGNQLDRVHKAKADDHQVMRKLFDLWEKKNERFSDVLVVEGEDLSSYNEWRNKQSGGTFYRADPMGANEQWVIHIAHFKQGVLSLSANERATPETMQLLMRFAGQFEQTYTRFLDLKKAEAQAREARKQASLDRIRAEIASMRATKDLEKITPLIWNELTMLEVPFFRCGVLIIEASSELVDVYLSTPSGESLAVMQLRVDEAELMQKAVEHWRRQAVYLEAWDQAQFIAWTRLLIAKKHIQSPKEYQASEAVPQHLALQFIPFDQGMLYVGSEDQLSESQIGIVRSLAEALSVAYARYDDFKQLEVAKNRIESTLQELKSTQKQLIHAEKMASLGELTAGIAHEIQNPLNFVNNFSEVSVDLVDELKAESSKLEEERDTELEKEILDDVVENLNKIRHHGQRASSIVKGMLEHSRAGNGKKEPTDINALADEYLRLAYHGLRAKDKSFNADFSAELDENLPKIHVVSQDIGRVLLNLINNAFYAVSKKAKAMPKDEHSEYKPTVSVRTRIVGDAIEIRVVDNADGIPEAVRDKIFQPFFTTKPTGEGTGLGLSLSYDIVTKGHGGTLEVQSEIGKGTEFIAKLPKS